MGKLFISMLNGRSNRIGAAFGVVVALHLFLALSLARAEDGAEGARVVLPRPQYFIAEPTPNDSGAHITLRWPRAEGERKDYQYVIYVSRDPHWRWFECRRIAADSGFVTDPDVAAYYPYRFSEGEEHFAIVEPAGALTVQLGEETVQYRECIPWLDREMQYLAWIKDAAGKLRSCRRLLVEMEQQLARRGALENRYASWESGWNDELRKLKAEYVAVFGAPGGDADFDVLEVVRRLEQRKAELQSGSAGGGGVAERLEAVRLKLKALARARQLEGYLRAARRRRAQIAAAIDENVGAFFRSAAGFALVSTLVHCETTLQLGSYAGVSPEAVTPRQAAGLLPGLRRELEEARRRASASDATAKDYDAYDRLRYVEHLASAYVQRAERQASLEEIENDLLWNLASVLGRWPLPAGVEAEAEQPDAARLGELLALCQEALERLERERGRAAIENWRAARKAFGQAQRQWVLARVSLLRKRYESRAFGRPPASYYAREITRLVPLLVGSEKRFRKLLRSHARRRYYFRLGVASAGQEPEEPLELLASAAARASLFDFSKLTNLVFALVFAGAVVGMISVARRRPQLYIRKIAGLDAVDEAIGRATEMGKPVLFVHGLTGIGSISVIASLNILSRIARHVAEYETDLLVVNNDPLVYSVSYEVVQEGYMEAGRPDAFKPDNVVMVASEQFPYVAAVAGIMSRNQPAANLFMGYFYAESLILAEAGALTGAIQIAGTDSFTQLPFFITTCDYTLMGEELYAASAYLSREPKLLGTIKAQDIGKSILLAAIPLGTALVWAGVNVLKVLFTAYEKAD